MKKKFLNIVGILGLFIAGSIGGQLGLEAAKAAFWQWSQTAINNQTADPSINWSEGMSPSSVNDSARAMMARLAEQGADTSGKLTTAGGPTAYTVTTNQGFPNPPQDGQVIGLSFNVTNNANPTLAVDGGAAEPILIQPGTGVPVNLLAVGVPYTMKFNGATSSWLMRNTIGGGFDIVPLGALLPYTGTTAPNANYIFAAGQCISTTTYAAYWVLMGSPGPGSCSAGQFAVIDLRGRVPAGIDAMGASGSAGRLTSAATGCGAATSAIGSVCATAESHTLTATEMPTHSHGAPMYDPSHYHGIPYSDPGHFHPTSTADPTHAHTAGIYDPGHGHGVAGGVYGSQNLVYMYYQGGSQGGIPAAISINAAGTGVLVNGGSQGNNATYAAGTGVYMSSGNGANTTGSKGTGITFNGSGGASTNWAANTGVRVNGVALDNTNNTGGSGAHSVVQPTITVNYIIRVL